MPGLVKIGKTSRSPQLRAQEISRGTGIPTPFVVSHQRTVKDIDSAERVIHQTLDGSRTNNRREFFAIDINKAKRITDKICDRYDSAPLTNSTPLPTALRAVYFLLTISLFILDAFLILSVLSLRLGTPNAVNQIGQEWAISFGIVTLLTLIGLFMGRTGRRVIMVLGTLLLTFIVALVLYFV